MTALSPETLTFLAGLKQRGVQLGLERMRRLVEQLGDPHLRVPAIHVAGTNGKGSVAAMIEGMLRDAGWRTGLYTSPHLVRFGERIQVNRVPLSSEELAAAVDALRPVVDSEPSSSPSYFEFMTALAFRQFARSACDVAVIEVGMGGRLDATNVVQPEVSVITSIGRDHIEFLGDTLEAIAAEKGGIIKPGRPVVIGRLPKAAEDVVRSQAARTGARVASVVEAFGDDPDAYPVTNLAGEYQRVNAATAVLAGRELGRRWRLEEHQMRSALTHVDWPGRWQAMRVGDRTVVVDASHNEEGARSLAANLAKLREEWGEAPVVIVGVLGKDRARPLLEVIARHAAEIHLVVPRQRRASTHEELAALVPASFGGAVLRREVADVFPKPGVCNVGGGRVPVVVTGSIYLAGEVLAALDPSRGPLEPELQDF